MFRRETSSLCMHNASRSSELLTVLQWLQILNPWKSFSPASFLQSWWLEPTVPEERKCGELLNEHKLLITSCSSKESLTLDRWKTLQNQKVYFFERNDSRVHITVDKCRKVFLSFRLPVRVTLSMIACHMKAKFPWNLKNLILNWDH